MNAIHDYVYADILRLWLAVGLLNIADMEIPPKKICARHWNGNQIASVDRHAGPLRRSSFPLVFFIPLPQADIPKSKCLQCRGFAGVVLADENNRLTQFNICVGETLEIFDS
jgi:hypothetical protein